MKQGNRNQGSRGVSDGQAGGRSGKPSRRGGAQDSVSAARRSLGKQGKRNELGKQGSQHALREDGRPCEGANVDAGRRGSKKTHGSGRPQGTSKSSIPQCSRGSGKPQSSHGSGKARASRGQGKAQGSRSVSAATSGVKRFKPQTSLPPRSAFLPVSRADMEERGWDCCDFVFVCGDAYVDHPSFGMAIITRLLEANHYKVGVICQPDWRDPESVTVLGRPRLGFLVSAGNMDSMVNHYTVAKKHRSTDAFSPGGEMGLRPDRAAVVYGNLIRRTYKDVPIVLGGIEASLRRLAHYDYWSDKLKRSILLDSGADLVSYGMGEHSIVEIADALAAGLDASDITFIDGTVYRAKTLEHVYDYELLPSFDSMQKDNLEYARSFNVQYGNSDPFTGKRLVEPYSDHEFVVQNPPSKPLTTSEMDAVYRLPYARAYHPMYEEAGGIPAIREVKFSLTSNRGCFGECAFCALTFHQGRIVQVRSHESIVEEAKQMIADPEFKGYIHDVGGPTADYRQPACDAQLRRGACRNKHCLTPQPCRKLNADHTDYLQLLRELRELPGVKKVFVRSGIRFDYVLADRAKGEAFVRELCEHHVSGQLRVAPEHVSNAVLGVMGKPQHQVYEKFVKLFQQANDACGLKQFVVPYLMSSHPGSTLDEAIELAEYVRDMGFNPEQVQDFYPTPSTMSTAMYFTGVDPRTMERVFVPKNPHEKALQRALIQYRDPKNHDLVMEALRKAGRADLIGFGPKCLIRPYKGEGGHGAGAKKGVAGAKNAMRGAKAREGGQGSGGRGASGSRGAAGAGKRGGSPNGGRGGKGDGARGKAPRR
ncbi:YgiQ family radical SAM protein [Senegalimassilia anaerobia]|uniref:YgiQ family radical SAM protein n=1 Tax=Senegalimassilia anaerobia TaxID=1473216 RepID=UPI003AB94B94